MRYYFGVVIMHIRRQFAHFRPVGLLCFAKLYVYFIPLAKGLLKLLQVNGTYTNF